jgi:DsbE subfamily thiol:disulfide oxidoreductase
MMRRLSFLLPLLAFAAIAGWFWLGLAPDRNPSAIPSVMIGKQLPEFDLPPLTSGSPGLKSSELKGRVTLISFFASWCVPCRAEHPLLFPLAQDKRIQIVGIAYNDKPGNTSAYLSELGNPYSRVVVDQSGRTAIDFGLTGVPETYLIDRDGVIRFHLAGPLSEDVVENQLKPLIAELAK